MSVSEIFKKVYKYNFFKIPENVGICALFVVIIGILYTVEDVSFAENSILTSIPQFFLEAWFAFIWHRGYLMKYSNFSMTGTVKTASTKEKTDIGKLLNSFLLRSFGFWAVVVILLVLIIILVEALLTGESETYVLWIVVSLFGIAFSVILLRLMPYFPSIAIGKKQTIREIWYLTSGHTVGIFLIYLAVLTPVIFLSGVLLFSVVDFLPLEETLNIPLLVGTNFIAASLDLLVLALGVSTNSEIYRQLTGFKVDVD